MTRRSKLMSSTATAVAAAMCWSTVSTTAFVPMQQQQSASGPAHCPMAPRIGGSGGGAFLPQSLASSSTRRDVAFAFIDDGADERQQGAAGGGNKLSRPERKAVERARKAQSVQGRTGTGGGGGNRPPNRRKNNNNNKASTKSSAGGKSYNLHSTAISQLTKESSAADVMRAIKRAQNLHDEHDIRNIERFLLHEVDEHFAYGYRGSLLARLAVAALHMNNHELARVAIDVRRREHRASMMPMESAAVIRGLLRVHNVTDAMMILDDELHLPLEGTPLTNEANRDLLTHRASALSSIASRHFFEGEPQMAVKACEMLTDLGPMVRMAQLTATDVRMPWNRIILGASQCESKRREGSLGLSEDVEKELPCNLVYGVLGAMTTFPSDNDDDVYESLSNALVRRTNFITGAVDMSGLPPSDRGEAAFIGRSNVGKSSLVNMITNRKSLAYTSKRPGKTQQFNYFAVNDKPDLAREIKYGDDVRGTKDRDSFYIVDLPGFGYAKVPQQQKQAWSDLTDEYLMKRKNLRVVFHLVDARHGPTPEDARIMTQVGAVLPKNVRYVVVLTKADKNVKGSSKKQGRVSMDVMNQVRDVMRNAKVGTSPVILTSAENKLGRDDIWRYLRLAAEA